MTADEDGYEATIWIQCNPRLRGWIDMDVAQKWAKDIRRISKAHASHRRRIAQEADHA